MLIRNFILGTAVLAFAVASLGCGGSVKLPDMTHVSGSVMLDGQRITSGQVTLVPEIEPATPVGFSAGQIDDDGDYVIYTSGKEGAPLGKYTVTVTPAMDMGPPKAPFDSKYSNSKTSPLKIEVTPNAKSGAYDLKLTNELEEKDKGKDKAAKDKKAKDKKKLMPPMPRR